MNRKTAIIILAILISTQLLTAQTEYRAKAGDTFYSISLTFDIPVELLLEYNGLEEGAMLLADQLLKIPQTYEVKPGDTYYGISRLLGIGMQELLDYNDRSETTILLAGETLQIPGKATKQVAESEGAEEEEEEEDATSSDDRENETAAGAGDDSGSATENSPSQTSKEPSEGFFWPHNGDRSRLTGKLKGEQFLGSAGDPVFSVSSGSVIWVAPYRGYNKLIIVKSPDTHVYAYGGNDFSLVKVGDAVVPGMEIGRLGVNAHEGEAKAFFFVYKDGEPVDPQKAPRS